MSLATSRKVSDIHSAKAAMAGFLFQIRRALCQFATASDDAHVSVETLDDVVLEEADGNTYVEQDKLSFRQNPVPDRSENLWNTLATWMQLIDAEELVLDRSHFRLVSNFPIESGIAFKLKQQSEMRDNGQIWKELIEIATTPSQQIAVYTSIAKKWPKAKFLNLISRISVTDVSCMDTLLELAQRLNLDQSIRREVIDGLTGWLSNLLQVKFEAASARRASTFPLSIPVSAFRRESNRLIALHYDRRIVLRAAQDILSPSRSAIEAQGDARFVRQLQLLDFGDEDSETMIDAIVDFLKADEETTRLAKKCEVTRPKFRDFETQLRDHWKHCRAEARLKPLPSDELTGQFVLNETLRVNATLDDQPVNYGYLTRGTYHAMANTTGHTGIGWHPNYNQRLAEIS